MSPRPWLLAALLAAACGGPRPKPPDPVVATPGYRATVRFTAFGVPHVTADGLGDLGFGQGWVTAKQHLCRLADQFVRVRGERSRYFGPGENDANLDSDFFHRHLRLDQRAAEASAASDDGTAIARGWVAGYNHFVTTGEHPEGCRGADWVTTISEADLTKLWLGIAMIASSRQFITEIARAAPGVGATAMAAPPPSPRAGLASNGWAIGGDATETGGALVVANPHFPWEGDLTFSEIHLTVPGELDVYGATIPGVPLVGIGFTRHHAWTHTFSSSTRFLVYAVPLDDSVYVHEDVHTIEVKGAGEVSRKLYRAEHGPMVASPFLPWSKDQAFALYDAALESAGSVVDLYLGFARATSLDGFRAAVGARATPFLNTIYGDVDGNAWYVDASAVPALSDTALAGWEVARKAHPGIAQAWQYGVVMLDGGNPDTRVLDGVGARGIVELTEVPELLRTDFVFNANDSYAFTNPGAPLSGHSPLFGAADGVPSVRSLMNLRMLRERGVAAAAGADSVWSRKEAATALLSNRSFTGEQLHAVIVERCLAEAQRRVVFPRAPKKTSKKSKKARPKPVRDEKLDGLCVALQQWDGRFGTESRGAPLWRELFGQLGAIPWEVAWDPQAASTPSGLAPAPAGAPDPIIAALEKAADTLVAAGASPSSTLGELQRAAIGSRIPVPGGIGSDGVANVVTWQEWNGTLLPRATRPAPAISRTGLGADGYPVNYGTSWIMIVDLTRAGPTADVLMTYGSDDELAMFGRGQLRPALFDEEAIAADPDLVTVEVISE